MVLRNLRQKEKRIFIFIMRREENNGKIVKYFQVRSLYAAVCLPAILVLSALLASPVFIKSRLVSLEQLVVSSALSELYRELVTFLSAGPSSLQHGRPQTNPDQTNITNNKITKN